VIKYNEYSGVTTTWKPMPIPSSFEVDGMSIWVLLADETTAVEVYAMPYGLEMVNPVEHPVIGTPARLKFEDVVAWNQFGWVSKPFHSSRGFHSPRMLLKAIRFATQAHGSQMRKFQNVPYITHPTAVAKLVELYGGSTLERVVALLHDTVEDTDVTIEQIVDEFGRKVSELVLELTIDKSDPLYEGDAGKLQYLKLKMVDMSEPALFIKLTDRLDNVSDLKMVTNTKFLSKYVKETIELVNYMLVNRTEISVRNLYLLQVILDTVKSASHFTFLSKVYEQNS
jgi:GTP diphosphokinase / guanosine-3',5'-bis(diphosphate) 3'-diphosphatase